MKGSFHWGEALVLVLLISDLILCQKISRHRPFDKPLIDIDSEFKKPKDNGGGVTCAACTIVITLADQLSTIHSQPIEQALDQLCDYLPSQVSPVCVWFVDTYGAQIIQDIEKQYTPDEVCLDIALCSDPTCGMSPMSERKKFTPDYPFDKKVKINQDGIGETPWEWLLSIINDFAQKHEPVEDLDDDRFSMIQNFRGSFFRGKDCDDFNGDYYPGRISGIDANIDFNCNGIYGTDQEGNSYEDLLCGESDPIGTIVIGDSGGAHFEIPPSYMNASEINNSTYDGLWSLLTSEFDYPQRSCYTGYENITGMPYTNSIYKKMSERNFCNHRDYQNLAVNGGSSSSMANDLIFAIARNQTLDHPALIFYELIGNDVCHPEHSYEAMSTVEQFTDNVLRSLRTLDKWLPKGSHIVFIGLANGGVLFEALHEKIHPIGVPYTVVYDFLNCLQISPCWGWMNTNGTVRNFTTQRSLELSAVYPQIIANYTFVNFDMHYIDWVETFNSIIQDWISNGGQISELIEKIDGFHPNQIAHSLLADAFWDNIMENVPSFLGNINPNNGKIVHLFGDQGGY